VHKSQINSTEINSKNRNEKDIDLVVVVKERREIHVFSSFLGVKREGGLPMYIMAVKPIIVVC
jgi:hypothetical protein